MASRRLLGSFPDEIPRVVDQRDHVSTSPNAHAATSYGGVASARPSVNDSVREDRSTASKGLLQSYRQCVVDMLAHESLNVTEGDQGLYSQG